MSKEGTNARERQLYGTNFSLRAQEQRMDEGQPIGIPTSHLSLSGTSNFGLDEVISNATHPSASFPKSRPLSIFEIDAEDSLNASITPHQHQQQAERPSATAAQILPSFAGELEQIFQTPNPQQPRLFHVSENALHPEQFYQSRNMEMGPNYGGSFPVAPPAAQGTVTNLGSGNYYLPTSNLAAQQRSESISTVQLPFIQYPYPQNPLGAEIDAPAPWFPMTQWANNPNLQQPYSLLSNGLGATPEMMQSRGVSSLYPAGTPSNYQTQYPNTLQQELLDIHPIQYPREMGDYSSSANVSMRMTVPGNSQQSHELQAESMLNPSAQGSGNPHPPRNLIYDPIYEEMGLPVDPHMRMFLDNNPPSEGNA